MKTISYYEAMSMLNHPLAFLKLHDWGHCPAVQVIDPFMLISVPGGSNGTHGHAGDWIVMHPDKYPMVVTKEVAERSFLGQR